jgi:predicted permease
VARLRIVFRNLLHRERVDGELDAELQATLELLVDEKIRSGMAPEAARRAARVELGSLESLKGHVQDERAGASLDSLLQDVRYALRLFRRAPGFTTVAILTLALGIGANAAIFGVVKSVLIDALPYAEADRLSRVQARVMDGASTGRPALSAAMVHEIASRQQVFESTAAFDGARDAVLGGEPYAQLVTRAWVEPGFFRTLGVGAALGRTFQDGDEARGHVPASGAERGPDNARGIVVTHAAWQRLFSGDPGIVGRDVVINAIPRTVVGVLPRGFVGPMGPVDFFFAFDLAPSVQSGAWWLGLVGRLEPGMTHAAAGRDVAALWASRDVLRELENLTMTVEPLRDSLAGRARTPLLVLLLSAALVLLVACANLAGALLARGLSRRKEFAVRVALGVGRGRLVRQLLTESAVLALAGGAAGLLLAYWLLQLLRGLAGPVLPSYAVLSLDPGVVLVTAVVSLGTGLAFGVAPALSVDRLDAQGALREDARGASEGHRPRRLRGVLVAAQMAVCITLLAGAGLLARSLWEMATRPLGFDPEGVLSATARLLPQDYPTLADRTRLREQLLERLRALPGVEAVAIANKPPALDPRRDGFAIEGRPEDATLKMVVYASVSDDYFRTLRIPLRRGRTFDASDVENGPPVTVVSEALARRYWPGGDALGARIRLGGQIVTVVGVVGDVRLDLSQLESEPMAYRSHRQESTGRLCVLVRAAQGGPLVLVKPLERELAALDPTVPLQQTRDLETLVEDVLGSRRLPLLLIGAFGTLALLLASVGVYGMFAGMAAAREREFAVRVALGSGPGAIARLLLRQGSGWMAAGLAGGALGIVLAVRLLRGFVHGVPAFDPIALGSAFVALVGCAALALLVPVRRATRVDPITALRAD